MDIRALVAMLFLSASLSGCLTEGNGASGDEDGLVVEDPPPYTQDGIYNLSLIHISEPTRPY